MTGSVCQSSRKRRRNCAALLAAAAFFVVASSYDNTKDGWSSSRGLQVVIETSSVSSPLENSLEDSPLFGTEHSYSRYVGYHKRTNPNSTKHSSTSNYTSLRGANGAPLAGPVSYWRAAKQQSFSQHVLLESTDLSDVFFYLGLALTWSVWLLKSFVKTDFLRYTQDSLLVRGHVLQITRENVESGIPTYKAIIDYFVGEDDENQIQVRKEFETQTKLKQGFGTVELLVLADEPTSSVLKRDWEHQLEVMQDDYKLHNNSMCLHWLPSNLWKRTWVLFLGVLVAASLAGSIVSARFLPPGKRGFGWWMVAICIIGLIPAAIGLRMALTILERYFQVRNGIILHQKKVGSDENTNNKYCDPFAMLDTNACDDAEAFSLAHTRQVEMSTILDETAGCYVIQMTPAGMPRDSSNVSDVSSVSLKLHQPSSSNSSSNHPKHAPWNDMPWSP